MSRPRTESALAFMRALEGEDVDREALPRTLAAVEADERRRFVEEELGPHLIAVLNNASLKDGDMPQAQWEARVIELLKDRVNGR